MTLRYDHLWFCVKTLDGSLNRKQGHWIKHGDEITSPSGWKFCNVHIGMRIRQRTHHPKQETKETVA